MLSAWALCAAASVAGVSGCATTSIGPDANLRIGGGKYLIVPQAGCRTPTFSLFHSFECADASPDTAPTDEYARVAARPIMLAADRKFTFRVKSSQLDALQVTVFAADEDGVFTSRSTETARGPELSEDFSNLAPGVYVVEAFAISQLRGNALYRFALQVGP